MMETTIAMSQTMKIIRNENFIEQILTGTGGSDSRFRRVTKGGYTFKQMSEPKELK